MINSRDHADRDLSRDTAELLVEAREGRRTALDILFGPKLARLRRWARGRLPIWARSAMDTADIIQDVVLRVLNKMDGFDVRGKGALEAYLRQGVQNRIRDEIRSQGRRPMTNLDGVEILDPAPSAVETMESDDDRRRYRVALARLKNRERTLIVGALELGYTHEQLALITRRPTAESARVALHRALRRLAQEMTRV